jgi:hypothetical protein
MGLYKKIKTEMELGPLSKETKAFLRYSEKNKSTDINYEVLEEVATESELDLLKEEA